MSLVGIKSIRALALTQSSLLGWALQTCLPAFTFNPFDQTCSRNYRGRYFVACLTQTNYEGYLIPLWLLLESLR